MKRPFLRYAILLVAILCVDVAADTEYYQEVMWKPRVMITPEEALNGFWPPSPEPTPVQYTPMGLDVKRLGAVPEAGVHPRVYLTPETADEIRRKMALGDMAPPAFKNMWSRFSKTQANTPLYAYLTQDDELGNTLADAFVQDFPALENTIAAFEHYSDSKDFNSVQKTMVAHGDPALSTGVLRLLAYDYLYPWLSENERTQARRLIAKVTHDRITNFMTVPDHWMINNHQGFGMVYMALLLQIEGEEGFNQEVYNLGVSKIRAMLDYYLTDTGMCYETIKGWLPLGDWMPVLRRHPKLLDHSHLHAKMDFYLKWLRFQGEGWLLRNEMRDSTFHVVWMMHYLYPEVANYEFLYSATFSSFNILQDPTSRWSNPVGTNWENLLLTAQDVSEVDFTKPGVVAKLENANKTTNETFWADPTRGYMAARNSWEPGDLYVDFAGKQDLVYGGHEGAEQGRWAMWSDGINWTYNTDLLFNKEATVQNMISIDGKSLKWPPVSSVWLGAGGNEDAAWAAVDYKDGYSFVKQQRHPLNSPALLDTNWRAWGRNMLKFNRDQQMQYHDSGVEYHDGYAHTDYGAWNNEQRLLEDYRPYNTVEKAYRTLIMAKGTYPYMITLDDVKKDDEKRSYLWNMALPFGMTQVATKNTAFTREKEPHDYVDILVASDETKKDHNRKADWVPPYHRVAPNEAVCLVRVFNQITSGQYPTAGVRRSNNHTILEVPGLATEGDFKVLIYPHKQGEPTPKSTWNKEKTTYTVEFPGQKDVWHFDTSDGGRTVFALERNGAIVQHANTAPPRPLVRVNGVDFDPAAKRYRQDADEVPKHVFINDVQVASIEPEFPAVLRYTLDGSEPTDASAIFPGVLTVEKTATLKIAQFNPTWVFGPKKSSSTTIRLVRQRPLVAAAPENVQEAKNGLRCRVYEFPTRIYDDKGFFDASKTMLPNLDNYAPIADGTVADMRLPLITPQMSMLEEAKGFYRLSGYVHVPSSDTYRVGLYSCGPVRVKIGGQTTLVQNGIFHQNQDWRHGKIALKKGWHTLEIIVTDPVFYKIANHDTMPVELTMRGIASGFIEPQFAHIHSDLEALNVGDTPTAIAPLSIETALESGVVQKVYSQPGKMLYGYVPPKDLLDIDALKPSLERLSNHMFANESNESISVYEGYFKAPTDGIYRFDTDKQDPDHDLYCNQLRLNDQVIVQRGAPGRTPVSAVFLKAGYYRLSFRLGASSPRLEVSDPNGVTRDLKANQLYRISTPRLFQEGLTKSQGSYEIYEPTPFTMEPPRISAQVEVRYTLDGSKPTPASPTFPNTLTVAKAATVTMAAFVGEKQVSEQSRYTIDLVDAPRLGQMIHLDMTSIRDDRRIATLGGTFAAKAFAGGHGSVVPEGIRFSKKSTNATGEANVNKEKSGVGIIVQDLVFNDNAMTLAIRAKFDDLSGQLMGKFGYNAWGKGYTTIQASLNNGSLRAKAQPADLRPRDKIKKDTWHSIIFTGSGDQTRLYLDGKLIAEELGAASLPISTLDFFTNMEATVSDLRIYNRPLHPHEIDRLVKVSDE